MNKSVVTVSVVIPCRNERQHIETCLTSILNQVVPEDGFEVIVADGMSSDGTREILARFEHELNSQRSAASGPVIRVINNPGLIVSKGLNAAIRAARGSIIIRLDAHTDYASDYLKECVATLRGTGADNVGGPWVAQGNSYIGRAIAAAFQSPFAVGGARAHDANYAGLVDTTYLGCWPKATFERFGLFDEELIRNQDDEHNLRITRGGGKVYQSPKIKSWYRPRSSLRALFNQYMQYGYWKVRVIQKHKLPASWRHLVPGAFVLTLAVSFLLSALSFLFSTFAPDSQLSALSIPILIFGFHVSAFSFSFLAALGAYVMALLAASVLTAAKTEWKQFWVLPLVFPCYHYGYGYGFLRGIWSFVIFRRGASASFTELTRSSPKSKATGLPDH